ncbi:ebd1553c-dbac-4b08-8b1c-bdaa498b47ad [Sclerotinia trifoliorum]|uniref:Ebd1553c-dbac-4b08-8b1c-bdaa498b47ad n=1 Tax=Sclerotinia trifoliorum TaxID=28548 RepID=A0A8H2ZKX0_9HELO|nr:ebd1553c-dbac-4b08-8b1c-bdaa498b47ad [Sclerotinia trifoliorum]
MTTLVRARNPLETLRMNQQPAGRRRSKRLAGYEEEDGDFQFTRVSKKAKTTASVPDPIPEAVLPVTTTVPRRTKKVVHERQTHGVTSASSPPVKKTRGAPKTNLSTPKESRVEKVQKPRSEVEPKRGTRKSTRLSTEKVQSGNGNTANGSRDHDNSIDMNGGAPVPEESNRSTIEAPNNTHSTVIALPFSDTPIINRNKELRKKGGTGQRRSSLGMRGRRASSLIDSGYSAIPHKEVETSQFYKHIEDGLPEPRRMKQLLTWTGERALPEKPAHGDPDSGAKLAARAISEALLKDFGTNSTFSNWFDREEKQPTRITKVVKKPNPKNIEAEENIQALEARVKQLEIEKAQWISFKKPPAPLPPLFPNTDADTNPLSPSQIDATLLDPEQSDILSLINSSSSLTLRENVSERLKTIHQEIEGKVDRFVDGIHKIEGYGGTVGRVADKILALSAVRLDERERRERELVGTRDVSMVEVLRSLSRILPEGSAR